MGLPDITDHRPGPGKSGGGEGALQTAGQAGRAVLMGAGFLGVRVYDTSHPCDLGTPPLWVSVPLTHKLGNSVRTVLLSSVISNKFLFIPKIIKGNEIL